MSSYDPFDLAETGDEAERKEREAKRRKADLQWLMDEAAGRRIVHRLLDQTGVFRSSYTGDNDTFFREGQRNVGLQWLAEVNATCPEQYALMLKEANERSDTND